MRALRFTRTSLVDEALPNPHPQEEDERAQGWTPPDHPALLRVDAADRLQMAGLAQSRDLDDPGILGGILGGMPGREKRLAR